MQLKNVFLFQSTHAVIQAQMLFQSKALSCSIINVPKHYSAQCGMALVLDDADSTHAQSLLSEQSISVTILPFEREEKKDFDLLSTVRQAGCSVKIAPNLLLNTLQQLPCHHNEKLLVGVETYDDSGVYQLTDDIALIETTDFFPPICSNPYDFGQIAAANALSDVFAMGGAVLTAMNIVMFPSQDVPLHVLQDILKGGFDKVAEAGGVIVGGHTINDFPPKYGLAVTGVVHPKRIMTNANAQPGEVLVLTKPVGIGIMLDGHRKGLISDEQHSKTLELMKLLNKKASEVMQEFAVRCATDITGFGLLGHALHIARASKVTLTIDIASVPIIPGVCALVESGCISETMNTNLLFIGNNCLFDPNRASAVKMAALDPQTSGGLLFTAAPLIADTIVQTLRAHGYPDTAIIGNVVPQTVYGVCLT